MLLLGKSTIPGEGEILMTVVGNTSVLFEPKISVVSPSVMAADLTDVCVCVCFYMCSGMLCLERSRPNTTS